MNKLNNYFMKPTYLKDLAIYPIKLMEYENFKLLANQFLLLDIPQLNNKRKQERLPKLKQDNLFDYLIDLMEESKNKINEMSKQIKKVRSLPKEVIKKQIEENPELQGFVDNLDLLEQLYSKSMEEQLCKLISMTVKKKVSFINGIYKAFVIYDIDEKTGQEKIKWVINKDNFYDYRKIVMEQNCLFTPRISSNKRSQEILDREAKKIFGDEESSLESIVAFVSLEYAGKDISEYTYYRVMADYKMAMKRLGYLAVTIYRANGCKEKGDKEIEIPNLSEDLGMLDNPFNKLLRQAKETELDKKLSNR